VLPNTHRVERTFARWTLTCLFISIENLLTDANWLEFWKQLASSKLLPEEVKVRRERCSECFKRLVKVLAKDVFEWVRESSFEFLQPEDFDTTNDVCSKLFSCVFRSNQLKMTVIRLSASNSFDSFWPGINVATEYTSTGVFDLSYLSNLALVSVFWICE